MIIVTLVLALMASAVTPRLYALQRGEARRKFETDLASLVANGSIRAKQSGQTQVLRLEESTGQFYVEVLTEEQPTEEPGGARGVGLYDEYAVDSLRTGSEGYTAADWSIEFYKDGSCSGGGIQFSTGDNTRYIRIDNGTCRVQWGNGDLPDTSTERWQAGEREVRQ